MSRVTATFATMEGARDAKTRLEGVGIEPSSIRILPDHADGATHDGDGAARDIAALDIDAGEREDLQRAVRDGNHVVTADVPAAHLVEAEEVIRQGDHARSAAHSEGQAIAPGGEPAAAVGATSTIGIADDGQQTRSDPLDNRKG